MMMKPLSQFFVRPDYRLHYLEWAGGQPPALFIPGFISNAYGALRLAEIVAPQHRVVAFDLKGRGLSDKPHAGYGIANHVADLHAFCQAQNIQSPILMGHSFGAAVALFFALQYPTHKIILLDGGTPPSEMAFELFMAYHRNLSYEYPSAEAYLGPYRQLPTLQPWTEEAEQLTRANIVEQADGRALRAVPRHVVEAELAQFVLAELQALTARYSEIQAPVLLIRAGWGSFGKEDQHISAEVLATLQEGLPQLQVYTMPEAGHTAILTVPDPQRDQVIRDFLAQ